MIGVGAVVGYAVGTAQVLFIDSWRGIAQHRRNLRLIQAELRRLATFKAKFGWLDGLPPVDEKVPAPPMPTELFMSTVGQTEWTLTDEYRDDNSQQSYLHLLDGFNVLGLYARKVMEVADLARTATHEQKVKLRERGKAYADAYDARVDEVLYLVDDGLRDITRRMEDSGLWRQFVRRIRRLPAGENPRPLVPNDPRVFEWKRKQSDTG